MYGITAIDLPPKLRNDKTVHGLMAQLDRTKARARSLSAAVQSAPGVLRVTGANQAGAALAGIVSSVRADVAGVPTAAAVGIGLVVAGVFTDSPDLVNAGNGCIAPVVAAATAKWMDSKTGKAAA